MSFWCVYPIFNWGNIVSKKCDQKYGVQRKNKTGEGGWPYRGVTYRRGLQTLYQTQKNTSGPLHRGGITNLPLLRTLLATYQKPHELFVLLV